MTDREALKQALDFIERVNKDGWMLADFEPQMYATLAALREALAQPAQQPLTDEQISAASKGHMTRNGFARAIEAAHGIKENT